MTKSRKRKSPRRGGSSGGYRPPDRPYRSITSQMTPEYNRAVREAADAELRGDFATALRLHRSVPFFRQSTHGERLQLMAELGPDAPGWLVNRQLTIQSRRRVWTGGDEAATNRALQLVVPMVYPEHIPFERIGCAYVEQVMPYIYERDWVVRQVDVYDLGALRRLVERHAAQDLLERTDQIEGWCTAPMRACRIEGIDSGPDGAIEVVDVSTRERLDVLDLGLLEQLEPGQHVLGRVVPTTSGPGAMFEWRPLPVSEQAANAVARDPRRWLTTLHSLARAGRLEPAFSHRSETSLTADLPRHSWLSLLGAPLDETLDQDPDVPVERALDAALALAPGGRESVAARRHVFSELLLDVALTERMRLRHARSELVGAWRLLAVELPTPARARCEEMAMWCDAASDLPEAM